jgi:hypothetical protein
MAKTWAGFMAVAIAALLLVGCGGGAGGDASASRDTAPSSTTVQIPSSKCTTATAALVKQQFEAITSGKSETFRLSDSTSSFVWNGVVASCSSRDDFIESLYVTPPLSKEMLEGGARLSWESFLNRYCALQMLNTGLCAQ